MTTSNLPTEIERKKDKEKKRKKEHHPHSTFYPTFYHFVKIKERRQSAILSESIITLQYTEVLQGNILM